MKTVLCYGDSNTYGYVPETGMRYPRDIRYPGRLQNLVGDGYVIIEEGCNGRTTIHALCCNKDMDREGATITYVYNLS